MSIRRAVVLCLLVCCVAACCAADAAAASNRPRKKRVRQESDGYLSFGAGYLSGDTTYHIADADATTGEAFDSELEFPIQTVVLDLEAGLITKDDKGRDAWAIGLSFSTDVGTASGKMKDSDWLSDPVDIALVGSAHPGKDIYSESSVDLNVRTLDLRVTRSYWPSESLAVGPAAGYLYQSLDFTARDLVQVGYGPYASGFSGSLAGQVLTYQATYRIPYAGIHTELQTANKNLHWQLDLGYSAWVKAEDEDDHILRTKRSLGTATGTAWLAAGAVQWDLEDRNAITVRGDYRRIDTKGTQTQYWYGNADAPFAVAGDTTPPISDRITSNQLSLLFLITSRF